LGTKNLFSGARETALAGNFKERDELIEIHCGSTNYSGDRAANR
jgi:hypothetical protein